ncbi:FAD-binding oxidoreductase [Streptomyces sp. NPDC051907]|uniref:FAD-binding oxidoreductase n=1 Tax=Streptomyces sp. NPDC051907 TaxID=3155284 RepID=UPI0034352D2E
MLPHVTTAFRPGDAGYEDELAGFQTGFALRPELIVAAADAEDVRRAVAYAAEHHLPVGVQATGHGLPGAAEGGVLISTRRMDGVRVDPAARTARVEAGARWEQVVETAAEHGLAPLNGSSPGVGVVSYTLGGGLGVLAREFGYAADHVLALDVVTADAEPRRVTAQSDPDLYWALLGGGHNFGVVTALEFGLVPVARLYGGSLLFDADLVERAVERYLEWTADLPEAMTTSMALVQFPDLPMVPAPMRGRYTASVRVAYTGDAAAGERLVAPLRAIGPALADSLREMPYSESHTVHSDPDFPHAYYGDSAVLSGLDAGTAHKVLALTGPDAPSMTVVQINHLGGALARAPKSPNAVPFRDARFLVRVLNPLQGPDSLATVRALHREVFDALAPLAAGRALNFAFGGGERTQGLYDPETLKRLAGLKAVYDPANLFRRNYNVSPGAR